MVEWALRTVLCRGSRVGIVAIVSWAAIGAAAGQPLPLPELPVPSLDRPAEPGTLAEAMSREPACRERTNGCEVCIAAGTAVARCSLPGIACQPEGWRCVREGSSPPADGAAGSKARGVAP